MARPQAAAGHEALDDSNGIGLIEVSELAAYVQDLVPKLVAGGEARAAVAARGTGGGCPVSALRVDRRRFRARPAPSVAGLRD